MFQGIVVGSELLNVRYAEKTPAPSIPVITVNNIPPTPKPVKPAYATITRFINGMLVNERVPV